VGTNGGGVFKSTNGGGTWVALNSGLTNTRILTLAIDPQTPTKLYAGTEGSGAFDLQQICELLPQQGCRAPVLAGKAQLLLKDKAIDRGDRLVWKWVKGAQTSPGAFGDPLSGTGYALCIYHVSGSANLVAYAAMPAAGECGQGPCWSVSGGSLKYRDKEGASDGIEKVMLRAGDDGEAKIIVKGRGENLRLPSLLLNLPVLVQLQATNGECCEATYSAAIKNQADQFKARAD